MNFHLVAISEIHRLLNTREHGLYRSEVEERQIQYGKNELCKSSAKSGPIEVIS